MNGFTTGRPVSDKLSCLHAHTHRNTRWRLYRKHLGVLRNRGSLLKTCTAQIQRTTEEKSSVTSPTALCPRQKRSPFMIPLPLFYSPRREAVTTCYIIFILCPFG